MDPKQGIQIGESGLQGKWIFFVVDGLKSLMIHIDQMLRRDVFPDG